MTHEECREILRATDRSVLLSHLYEAGDCLLWKMGWNKDEWEETRRQDGLLGKLPSGLTFRKVDDGILVTRKQRTGDTQLGVY